jgi:DNA polymerase I-like protein with 3'-5' exonuclease and polymerase domains
MFFYFDFEYRDNTKADSIILVTYMSSIDKLVNTIDLRNQMGIDELQQLFKHHINDIWVAYNAVADLTCLLSFGLDIKQLNVIDLMAEARMITLTHSDHISHSASILASLESLEITIDDTAALCKEITREIILENQHYNDEQWLKIVTYGKTDVTPLPYLLNKIWDVHLLKEHNILLNEMIERGNYIKALACLDHTNNGFPVDTPRLNKIFNNKTKVLNYFQTEINKQYGEIYAPKGKDDLKFSYKAFKKWLEQQDIDWKMTDADWPVLRQEYFQEKLPYHPELRNLYDVRKTLQSLNGVDLRSRVNNDHIKAALFPFAQKTSRNSYKPTKGYMLNLTPWMRNLIKPQQGKVFVGLDWSQQEIGIAAALSGDKNYLDIYNSIDGDVYLALAKKSGSVPKNATKQSHPLERDIFKTIQLGIGYGKGVSSLAGDIYWLHANNNEHINLSKAEAYDVAYEIYHWHKNSFNVYWSWISETIQSARALGFYKSLDGWVYFVDQNTRDTQLLNLPMQSNGAAMLRKAMINCNELQGIEIICTLHDAIYFTCDEGTTDKTIKKVKQCMDNACTDLLDKKIKIKVDASIYDHQSGYISDKGQALLNIVQSAISSMDEDKAA